MEIHIDGLGQRKIRFSGTVAALLEKLYINPDEVVVAKGDEIVSDEAMLLDTDAIRIMKVISGG